MATRQEFIEMIAPIAVKLTSRELTDLSFSENRASHSGNRRHFECVEQSSRI